MCRAAHPVGEHTGEWKVRTEARQAMGYGRKALGHRGGVDDEQHRNSEQGHQVGAGGGTAIQTHDALYQEAVGFGGGLVQKGAAMVFAAHPEIELVDRTARGPFEDHGVEEIRAGLEYPYPQPLFAIEAGRQ